MKLRKLRKEEHQKTREMWERIFTEDTPEFLDYYYSVKTEENEIYVIENDEEICAMLHLNPYRLQVGSREMCGHYIVAVATKEEYRGRRFMAELLKSAEADMKKAGEPFTFLMPAAEAIYYPHGYRYIYRQKQGNAWGKKTPGRKWEIRRAVKTDCKMLADFANQMLEENYEVFARRDSHYYEMLLEEQVSENGGIMLVSEKGKTIGFFLYAKGEGYELREPLFLRGYEAAFYDALYELTGNEQEKAQVSAYGEEDKPMIMAKVLNIPQMFLCMRAEREVCLRLDIYDNRESFLGRFLISGKERLKAEEIDVKPNEEAEQITIGSLTSLIFGYQPEKEQEFTDKFKSEWGKIKPLQKIFLNEVV